MSKKVFGISLVVLLALVAALPAFAAEYVSVTAQVTAIDEEEGFIRIRGEDATYLVRIPADFDVDSISKGGWVSVAGNLSGSTIKAGFITAVAAPVASNVTLFGAISATNDAESSFELFSTTSGESFTVIMPEDFAVDSIGVDDLVLVEGQLLNGVVTATSITVQPGPAAQVDLKGEVIAVSSAAGSFTFESKLDGAVYTVVPFDGFDLSALRAGDKMSLQGTAQGEVITASIIDARAAGGEARAACSNGREPQAALNALASFYGAAYSELRGFFCDDDYGVGQILLALQTARLADNMTAAEVLELRTFLGSWGAVWRNLGMEPLQAE